MDEFTSYVNNMWKKHKDLVLKHASRIAMCKKDKKLAKALEMYKGPWFSPLNGALRKGQPVIGELKSIDDSLQALMTKQKIGFELYRSLDGEFGKKISRLKIGGSFIEPGYSSASFDPKCAIGFDSSDMTLLVITPNCKHLYIDAFRDIYCKNRWVYQSEVLLDKNVKYTVLRKEKKKSIVMLNQAFECKEKVDNKKTVTLVYVTAT